MKNKKNLIIMGLSAFLGICGAANEVLATPNPDSCEKLSKNLRNGTISQSWSMDSKTCILSVIIRANGPEKNRSYYFTTDGEFGIIDSKSNNPKGAGAWREDATRSFYLFPRRFDQILIKENPSEESLSIRLVSGDWISIDQNTGHISSNTLTINQRPIEWDSVGVEVKSSDQTIVMSTIQYWGGEQLKSNKASVKNQYSTFKTIDGKKCRIKNNELIGQYYYELEFGPTKRTAHKWIEKREGLVFALENDQQTVDALKNAARLSKNKQCLDIADSLSRLAENINTATIEPSVTRPAGVR